MSCEVVDPAAQRAEAAARAACHQWRGVRTPPMLLPGGVPELREKLEAAQRGLDAVRTVVGSIEKTLW